MSLNRYATRRDVNEQALIHCARQLGWTMVQIGKPVDFIGCLRGVTHLIEIKTETGTLTKAQQKFVESWPGNVTIWRTADDVIAHTSWLLRFER
jgi:hypothetical protein